MTPRKIFRAIACIIIAIVAFNFSSKINKLDDGHSVSKSYYGGDAYTGIQHAAAETGTNVHEHAGITQKGFQYLFILTGLGFLAAGIVPLIPDEKKQKDPKDNIPFIKS